MSGKKEQFNCNGCRKSSKKSLESILTVPFSNKTLEFFSYFMYSAPDIESIHSTIIKKELHTEIFSRMMDDRHFKYKAFCASNARIENELKKASLDGDDICLKCKRFICKRKQTENHIVESDLDCFLRHIRNSIAHGRTYCVCKTNNIHLVFEDVNSTKKSQRGLFARWPI